MTTKEAIERSIAVWEWLLENPTCDKEDYPWPADEYEPRFWCYLCEHCQTEHKCPVDWSDYGSRSHLLGVCGFVCENQDSPYMHWLVGSVDKRPLRIETILRLHKEALGKLERGELENREDNNSMKLEDCE